MAHARKQRPEALATFAEASRSKGKKPDDLGLTANAKTAPIPTDSKKKDDAATRVLQEGATGEDRNSDEAIDKLPDRIIESREGNAQNVKDFNESGDVAQVPDANVATAGAPTSDQGTSEKELSKEYKTGEHMGP
jgi:hypothetical protein